MIQMIQSIQKVFLVIVNYKVAELYCLGRLRRWMLRGMILATISVNSMTCSEREVRPPSLQAFLPTLKKKPKILPNKKLLIRCLKHSLIQQSLLTCLKLTWKDIYHLKRLPYFFLANLFLKQGISFEYVMVDFICMGKLGLNHDILRANTLF